LFLHFVKMTTDKPTGEVKNLDSPSIVLEDVKPEKAVDLDSFFDTKEGEVCTYNKDLLINIIKKYQAEHKMTLTTTDLTELKEILLSFPIPNVLKDEPTNYIILFNCDMCHSMAKDLNSTESKDFIMAHYMTTELENNRTKIFKVPESQKKDVPEVHDFIKKYIAGTKLEENKFGQGALNTMTELVIVEGTSSESVREVLLTMTVILEPRVTELDIDYITAMCLKTDRSDVVSLKKCIFILMDKSKKIYEKDFIVMLYLIKQFLMKGGDINDFSGLPIPDQCVIL
jgi:hypothetical protein